MQERVLRFLTSPGAESFDELALAVFRYQAETNHPYRKWCEALGRTPASVTTLEDIPAVPVAVFKELELSCGLPAAEFRTSGTTRTGVGRHLLPSLEPYRVAALTWFKACVMPEGWKMRTLVLAPPPSLRPASSLSRMLGWVVDACGEDGSGWFVGAEGLDRERLAGALLDASRGGVPVLVLATTAALLTFLDYCDATGLSVALPGGSRLMDTGGQKGTGAAWPRPATEFQTGVYRRVTATLGIPAARCVNEYGMTELCSQFYDDILLRVRPGVPPTVGPPQAGMLRPQEISATPRIKAVPPWVRTRVVDPVTLAPAPDGQTGLLVHLDLANVGSVMAVQTEDLGTVVPGGFVLDGRPRAAEARGCGLTFEELARAAAR